MSLLKAIELYPEVNKYFNTGVHTEKFLRHVELVFNSRSAPVVQAYMEKVLKRLADEWIDFNGN